MQWSTWFWQQKEKWILGAILVLALVIRLVGFPQIPVSLYWDEMAIWNDALSIRDTGLDLHARSWFQPLFISYGDYKLPVYIWIVSLFSMLTEAAFIAVRLPNLLAGISMVLGSFLLVKGFFTKRSGLATPFAAATAGVLAVIPWTVHFSTVGFEGHLSSAWLLWSMTALVWSWRVNRPLVRTLLITLTVVLGVLAVYTYFSTRFVWPILFIGAIILWWHQTKRWWWVYGVAGVLWFLALTPMFQADFYAESNKLRLSTENVFSSTETQPDTINAWRMDSGNTRISRILYNRPSLLAFSLVKNISQHLDPVYLFIEGDGKLRHGMPDQGLVYPVLAPFLVVGLLVLWRRNWRVASWLSVWWLVSLIPASVPTDTPHALRSLNAVLPVVAFIGYGVAYAFLKLRELRVQLIVTYGVVAGISSILIFQITQFMTMKVIAYPQISATEWQVGYTPLAKFIAEHRAQFETVFVERFDDRFFLYYQPYSGLSWSEIQSIQSEGFARQTLGNVHILNTAELDSIPPHTLVIIETDDSRTIPENWQLFSRIQNELNEEAFVAYTTPRE